MSIIEIAMLAVMVGGPVALGIYLSLLLGECEDEPHGMVADRRQQHYGSRTE
jgi:hypothetical protein